MTINEIMQEIEKERTYTARKANPLYIGIGLNGNKKLINNDVTRFIIWNLPAKITCPYATELCKGSCYAVKAENVYPDVIPARHRNLARSRQADFSDAIVFSLVTELLTPKYKGKKVVVRIHESGDFYNRVYADSWLTAIKKIQSVIKSLPVKSIVFMAYTKSLAFFPDNETIKKEYPTLVIRSSIWDDTKPEMVKMTEDKGYPIYTAGTMQEIENAMKTDKSVRFCGCTDCAKCGMCWNRKAEKIYCEIH